MEKINPSNAIENIIKAPELKNIITDYGEIFADSFIKDSTLKDIPLIGTLLNLINFGNSINKNITAKKIFNFLFHLSKIPENKRNIKINQINSSKKYQHKVGETLFEILDKIDSEGKPEILGRLFVEVIEERIDYTTFLKIAHLLKFIFYYDLIKLRNVYNGTYVNGDIDDSFIIHGIVVINHNLTEAFEASLNFDNFGNEKQPSFFTPQKNTLTEMGKLIIEIGMKE